MFFVSFMVISSFPTVFPAQGNAYAERYKHDRSLLVAAITTFYLPPILTLVQTSNKLVTYLEDNKLYQRHKIQLIKCSLSLPRL